MREKFRSAECRLGCNTVWRLGRLELAQDLLATYYLLLNTYCSLLTTHYLLFTNYCSLLAAHYLLLTTCCSLISTHYLPLTTHREGALSAGPLVM